MSRETAADTGALSAADVVLAVADDDCRGRIESWFAGTDHRLVVPDSGGDIPAETDLCVVDAEGLRRHGDSLSALSESDPAYLPFLFVSTDDDALADRAVWERFDDVIVAPLREPEIAARVEGLLARRRAEAAAIRNVKGDVPEEPSSAADVPTGGEAAATGDGPAGDDGPGRPPETLQTSLVYLQELYRITSLEDIPFEEKLGKLLELGRRRLGVPYSFLTRIEGDTQRIVESRGDHPLLQPGESCPLDQAYCRKTVEQEGLLGVQDALDEGWAGDPAYETFELGAYVGGKVHVDGDLFGTLCFAATEARDTAFSPAERTFIELMTQWMGRELERRRREAELQREVERLDEFASLVSHDLRNPLNVAKGRLELAVERSDDEDAAAAYESLERMERLIEDLLQLAREGQLVAETEAVSLADRAWTTWESVETGDATLSVEDATVRADPERLDQLLGNLFRNAVEHGGEGVAVTVGPTPTGFYVADDGPGIPADRREEVFESGYTTAAEGTGFGLAIVEEIAEAHGWSVRAEESERGGAKFVVET